MISCVFTEALRVFRDFVGQLRRRHRLPRRLRPATFCRRKRLALLFGAFVLSYLGSTLTLTRKNADNDLKQ